MNLKKNPRGLSNNNPGNIRISSDKFQGEVIPSGDKAFKQFESMAYGYRAVFKLLITYYKKYGLKTIRAMISRWAPPVENHTEKYINFVASRAGVSPDQEIDIHNMDLFCNIVAAISYMENGQPADIDEVKTGYDLL